MSITLKQKLPFFFRASFPFSWAIEIQLDKLHRGDDGEHGSLHDTFVSTLLGETVEKLFQEQNEIASLFLYDLLRFKVNCNISIDALDLVGSEMLAAAKVAAIKRIRNNLDDVDDFEVVNLCKAPISPVDIYKTVVDLRPRLQIIVSLFNIIPGLEQRMTSTQRDDFTLDISALKTAFEMLAHDLNKLSSDRERIEWGSKITSLSTYLKQLDRLVKRGGMTEESSTLMDSLWKESKRTEIIKLFFDHIMVASIDEHIRSSLCNTENVKSFWFAFKDLDFSSRTKNFDFFLRAIEKCCRKAGDVFMNYKGIQQCLVCLEAINIPVDLPCQHVGCKACLEDYFNRSTNRRCPHSECKEVVPEDFAFLSAINVDKAVKEHSKVRKILSQLFLDVLQRFVFVKESPPHQGIIDALLSFIVTQHFPKEQVPKTKSLSPFPGDYIDPKPVIRSFVLQLLFRYDISTIEVHLNKFLESKRPFVENQDQLVELCTMIVQCLEDSFVAKNRTFTKGQRHQFKSAIEHMQKKDPAASVVMLLWNIALDRLSLNTVANAINNYLSNEVDTNAISNLLEIAVQFVKQHIQGANLKKYLVRQIAVKHQTEAILEWKKQEDFFPDLLPESLRLSKEDDAPDIFLHLDPDYKQVRDGILTAWLCNNFDQLTILVDKFQAKPMIWSLAFHYLTQVKTAKIPDLASFEEFLLRYPWLANIWRSSLDNLIPCLMGHTYKHNSIFSLLVHFRLVLSYKKLSPLLFLFTNLTQNPRNCANLFLPTMPHDETLEVKAALMQFETRDLVWYQCPNRHIYAIGECGRPDQLGVCPTCRAAIGGLQHNVQPGNQTTILTDQTKTGYILGVAEVGLRSSAVRSLSGLEVAIVRFFLNIAMLEGSRSHLGDLQHLIVDHPDDACEFLANHLCLNLTQISECLGKNTTEAIILLHQVIKNFAEFQSPPLSALNSKDSVKQWETEFARTYIEPARLSLDQVAACHALAIKENAEESANALQDILKEEDQPSVFPEGQTSNDLANMFGLTQFWRPWENICIERIISKVGNEQKLKEKCPFLFHLLLKEQVCNPFIWTVR